MTAEIELKSKLIGALVNRALSYAPQSTDSASLAVSGWRIQFVLELKVGPNFQDKQT